MIITCKQITETLETITVPQEEALSVCRQSDLTTWLDFQAFELDELEDWLDKLEIKGLSKRLCLEARHRSGFYPIKKEIFMVVPAVVRAGDTFQIEHLAFLCKENLLITFHQEPVFTRQQLEELKESHTWLPSCSIAALVSSIALDLSHECLKHAADLRNSILSLEERMDHVPDTVEISEILEIRAELLNLGMVVGDQLPPVQSLSTTDKPFFKIQDTQEYMNSAVVNLQAANRALDWLDARISALRAGFQMHAQDKTNRRLNMLTLLSAVFMPITLLAGIWGMNFESMPELTFPFGYPLALGLMLLIGCGMLAFFYRNKWLD